MLASCIGVESECRCNFLLSQPVSPGVCTALETMNWRFWHCWCDNHDGHGLHLLFLSPFLPDKPKPQGRVRQRRQSSQSIISYKLYKVEFWVRNDWYFSLRKMQYSVVWAVPLLFYSSNSFIQHILWACPSSSSDHLLEHMHMLCAIFETFWWKHTHADLQNPINPLYICYTSPWKIQF